MKMLCCLKKLFWYLTSKEELILLYCSSKLKLSSLDLFYTLKLLLSSSSYSLLYAELDGRSGFGHSEIKLSASLIEWRSSPYLSKARSALLWFWLPWLLIAGCNLMWDCGCNLMWDCGCNSIWDCGCNSFLIRHLAYLGVLYYWSLIGISISTKARGVCRGG